MCLERALCAERFTGGCKIRFKFHVCREYPAEPITAITALNWTRFISKNHSSDHGVRFPCEQVMPASDLAWLHYC